MDHMLDEAMEWQYFLSMEMIVDCIEQWMVLKVAPQTSGRPPNPFQVFLRPCQRVHKVKTILIIIQRHLPFSLRWICTDGAKTIEGKTTAFAWIKAMALNLSSSYCIPHHDPVGKKKMPASFKNVIDDEAEIINFIKSWPWNTVVFNILWWKGKYALSTAACQRMITVMRKSPWSLSYVLIIHYFSGNTMATWLTNKPWLFIWQACFRKGVHFFKKNK